MQQERGVSFVLLNQLAKRIGVSQPRVIAIEKAEANDSITLTTLRQAAEALNCTLVYPQ